MLLKAIAYPYVCRLRADWFFGVADAPTDSDRSKPGWQF